MNDPYVSDSPSEFEIQQSLLYRAINIDSSAESDEVVPDLSTEPSQRLIEHINSCFGIDSSSFTSKEHIADLFSANNYHYRRSRLVLLHRLTEQECILATRKVDGVQCIISPKGSRFIVYDYVSDHRYSIKRNTLNKLFFSQVLELYPVLPPDAKSFKQLFFFAFNAIRNDAIISLLFSLGLTVLGLLSPVITSHVIGDVVPSGDVGWILSTFVISVLLALYTALVTWVQSYYENRVSQKLSRRLGMALYKRLLDYPLDFVEGYTTGDLASRVTALTSVVSTLSASTLSLLIQTITLFGFLGMMVYVDWQLSVAGLLVVLIASVLDALLVRKQLKYTQQTTELSADLYNKTLQTLGAITQIRTNSSETYALNNWFSAILKISNLSYASARLGDFNTSVSSIVSIIGSSAIYAVLVFQLLHSGSSQSIIATATSFIIFTSAYSSFSSSFAGIISFVNQLCGSFLINWRRGIPLLRQVEEQTYQTDSRQVVIDRDISFNNVSFAYPGSEVKALNNCTFKIRSGKFNVIFGPSGSGKSTIVSLLCNFYKPLEGTVTLGDHDLNELDLSFFRKQIGVVLQNGTTPPGSIVESVSGGLNIPEDEIWNALSLVNIADEVMAFPMKLETMLSEGASNISGGQRQRLAIARALLMNPRLLIEDESTSALDNESQSIIVNNLKKLNITRIVVAHRLSAIRDCDHLVILNSQGQVEVEGDYQYCLGSSGYLKSIAYS